MAALLVLGPRLLPEFRAPEAGRLDLPSAALSLVAILAVIWGVKHVATEGAAASSLLAIAGGAGPRPASSSPARPGWTTR